MLFPQVLLMALALLPVACIEAAVIRGKVMRPVIIAYRDVGLSNVCTTVVGVPIAWALTLLIELLTAGDAAHGIETPTQKLVAVTLQAAWLIPYERHLHWMIPAAATVLLVPSCVVSVFMERWILCRLWPDVERAALCRAVLVANLWSYVLLLLVGSLWTFFSFK